MVPPFWLCWWDMNLSKPISPKTDHPGPATWSTGVPRWWQLNYFSFHPGSWWKGSNLTNNFVHGLVQPPTRSFWCRFGKLFDESFVLKKRVPSIFNYHFFKKGGPEYFWRNKHLPRTWTFQHSQCLDLSSPLPTGRIFICEVVSSWKTPIT